MSEFTKWRRSISEMLSVTERNLNAEFDMDADWSQPRQGAMPDVVSSVLQHQLGQPQRRAQQQVQRPTGCPGNATQSTPNSGGVYIDTSLAYRLDSICLHLSTLQKDFDHFRAASSNRERQVVEMAAAAREQGQEVTEQWARCEKRLNGKMERLEQVAEDAQNSIYGRVPGIGLTSSPDSAAGLTAAEREVSTLRARVNVLEEMLKQMDQNVVGMDTKMNKLVEEEVETRTETILREAAAVARKAAGQEVRCKFDFVQNELNETVDRVTSEAKAEISKRVAQFRTDQAVASEKSAAQTSDTVAKLRQDMEGLRVWKDIAASRIQDAESDMNKRAMRLQEKLQQQHRGMQTEVEQQLAGLEEKLGRRFEVSLLDVVTSERLDAFVQGLRNDMNSLQDRTSASLTRFVDEKTAHVSSSFEKRIGETSFAVRSLQASVKQDIASVGMEMEGRIRSEEQHMRSGVEDLVRQMSENLSEKLKVTQEAVQKIEGKVDEVSSKENTPVSLPLEQLSAFVNMGDFKAEIVALKGSIERVRTWAADEVAQVRRDLAALVHMATLGSPQQQQQQHITKPPLHKGASDTETGWESGYETGVTTGSSHVAELRRAADEIRVLGKQLQQQRLQPPQLPKGKEGGEAERGEGENEKESERDAGDKRALSSPGGGVSPRGLSFALSPAASAVSPETVAVSPAAHAGHSDLLATTRALLDRFQHTKETCHLSISTSSTSPTATGSVTDTEEGTSSPHRTQPQEQQRGKQTEKRSSLLHSTRHSPSFVISPATDSETSDSDEFDIGIVGGDTDSDSSSLNT